MKVKLLAAHPIHNRMQLKNVENEREMKIHWSTRINKKATEFGRFACLFRFDSIHRLGISYHSDGNYEE